MSRQENRSEPTVPNLYKMLGLDGPEESGDAIGAKIARLLKKAEAIAAKDPKKAEQARKLAAVARKQLCDPSRKKKFDALWQSQYGPSARQAGNAKREGGQSKLNPTFSALLPKGSPTEAFDLAAYLKVAPAPRFDRQEFEQMVASVVATAEPDVPEEIEHVSEVASTEAPAPELSRPPMQAAGKTGALAPAAKTRLGKQLREKRKKSFLLQVLGLLACMAIVLGLIAFLLRPQQPDDTLAENGPPAMGNVDERPADTKPRPPRRSGLPQVGMPAGEDAMGTVVDLRPSQDAPASADDMELFMPDSPQLDSLQSDEEPSMAPDTQPADPVMTDAMAGVEKPPGALPESIQETLTAVMQLAADYKYDEAVEGIASARGQTLSEDQTVQLQRVEKIVLLAQQGHASLAAKIQSMSAGESFLVGTSAQIAFVSGDSERISIRLRGQNRNYTYAELPPGLLYALLDLALDQANATSLAARGAFVLLQPNRTNATIRKARELLVTAAGSGAFEEDLPQVVDDFGL